jgi:hypothetical protein
MTICGAFLADEVFKVLMQVHDHILRASRATCSTHTQCKLNNLTEVRYKNPRTSVCEHGLQQQRGTGNRGE